MLTPDLATRYGRSELSRAIRASNPHPQSRSIAQFSSDRRGSGTNRLVRGGIWVRGARRGVTQPADSRPERYAFLQGCNPVAYGLRSVTSAILVATARFPYAVRGRRDSLRGCLTHVGPGHARLDSSPILL